MVQNLFYACVASFCFFYFIQETGATTPTDGGLHSKNEILSNPFTEIPSTEKKVANPILFVMPPDANIAYDRPIGRSTPTSSSTLTMIVLSATYAYYLRKRNKPDEK